MTLHEAFTYYDGDILRLQARQFQMPSPDEPVPENVIVARDLIESIGPYGNNSFSSTLEGVEMILNIQKNYSAALFTLFLDGTEYGLGEAGAFNLGQCVVVSGINRVIDRLALEEFVAYRPKPEVDRLGFRPLMATRNLPWSNELKWAAGNYQPVLAAADSKLHGKVWKFMQHANHGFWPMLAMTFLCCLIKGVKPRRRKSKD